MACEVTIDKCQWEKMKGQRLGLFQGRSQQQWLATELTGDKIQAIKVLEVTDSFSSPLNEKPVQFSPRKYGCPQGWEILVFLLSPFSCVCGGHVCVWRARDDVRHQSWLLFHMIHRDRVTQENPELANTASLNSQFALRTSSAPSQTGITGQSCHPPSIYVDSRNLNSGLPIYTAKS